MISIKCFNEIKESVIDVGKEMLRLYKLPYEKLDISIKNDGSPISIADKISQEKITEAIKNNDSNMFPIISEEGIVPTYEERKWWSTFWLIDPLDGTKEFINKTDDFTINIALIHKKKPVFGMIYNPVTCDLYYTFNGKAFHINVEKAINNELNIWNLTDINNKIAVCSRHHKSTDEDKIYKFIGVTKEKKVGSSLKFCYLATGKAHIYYRINPTMEWDTAAGQAILESAGGYVYNANTLDNSLEYNKKDIRNGSFFCTTKKNDIEKLKKEYERKKE